jgi:hypothetical protein
MAKKHESKWNIEDLTDPDIYEAIRYLEPDPKCQKDDSSFVICITIVILLLGCLGFMWLVRK